MTELLPICYRRAGIYYRTRSGDGPMSLRKEISFETEIGAHLAVPRRSGALCFLSHVER